MSSSTRRGPRRGTPGVAGAALGTASAAPSGWGPPSGGAADWPGPGTAGCDVAAAGLSFAPAPDGRGSRAGVALSVRRRSASSSSPRRAAVSSAASVPGSGGVRSSRLNRTPRSPRSSSSCAWTGSRRSVSSRARRAVVDRRPGSTPCSATTAPFPPARSAGAGSSRSSSAVSADRTATHASGYLVWCSSWKPAKRRRIGERNERTSARATTNCSVLSARSEFSPVDLDSAPRRGSSWSAITRTLSRWFSAASASRSRSRAPAVGAVVSTAMPDAPVSRAVWPPGRTCRGTHSGRLSRTAAASPPASASAAVTSGARAPFALTPLRC